MNLQNGYRNREVICIYAIAGKMSCSNADILPEGFVTYSDKNVDLFLQQIEDNNVLYYDARSKLIKEDEVTLLNMGML